jgi:hypothetical protein
VADGMATATTGGRQKLGACSALAQFS